MSARLIGGPDLRARLASLADVPAAFTEDWANTTVTTIRQTKPPSKRSESDAFTTKVSAVRGAVYGAYWWIFVDRGTKAHDIGPKRAHALRFNAGGGTIFAAKVHKDRQARRPFISKAAQDAFSGTHFAETVVKLWNRRRFASHKAFL